MVIDSGVGEKTPLLSGAFVVDWHEVIFALGGHAGGVSMFVIDGNLHYEYSSLLLRRTTVDAGELPQGDVRIAMEMRTQERWAAPADLTF